MDAKSPSFTFCLLADRPELCEASAEAMYNEWPETWHEYGMYSSAEAADYYRQHCVANRSKLPMEFLCVDKEKGKLAAAAGIDIDDM